MRIMLDVGAFQREENRNGECAGKRRFETLTVFLLRGENVVFSIQDDSTRLEQVSSQTLYEDEGFEIIPTDSYHPVKYFGSSRISSESYTCPPL